MIFAAVSCQKKDDVEPLDYSVQVIPDIATILHEHYDLINVMDSLGQLHFGDNPPRLYTVDTTDGHQDTLGFCHNRLKLLKYLKKAPSSQFKPSDTILSTYQFLFCNQHKGISSLYFRNKSYDNGPNNHYIESASRHDSVFIMGAGAYFTAYYFQNLKKDLVTNGITFDDPGAEQAIILSGQVAKDGIKDFYIGFKLCNYSNANLNFTPGFSAFNIGDVVVYYKAFMPFTYWKPDQTNND